MGKSKGRIVKELDDFIEEKNPQTEEELYALLQEFTYEKGSEISLFENSIEGRAMKKLNEAVNAKSEKKAIALAKEALKINPNSIEVKMFILNFNPSLNDKLEGLNQIISDEKNRLVEEGYYIEENIGDFYGLWETRDYITLLFEKMIWLTELGKFGEVKNLCLEILRLNNNDNLGVRYTLMGIYAQFEDSVAAEELIKKYPEDTLAFNIALMCLYYKLGDEKKAIKYLKKAHKSNKHFYSFLTTEQDFEEVDSILEEAMYIVGEKSEVVDAINTLKFLLIQLNGLTDWMLKNKITKSSN